MPLDEQLAVIDSALHDAKSALEKSEEIINQLSDMLCRTCARCQTGAVPLELDVATWWRLHQNEDRDRTLRDTARKKAEALIVTAAAKLTPAERRAVGL